MVDEVNLSFAESAVHDLEEIRIIILISMFRNW